MSETHMILCVDDEVNILRMLRRLLQDEGYQVLLAESAEEGLKLLNDNKVDLIISDQRMPAMSGSDFFRITKEKYPQAVRIMMSGYADFDSLVNAVNEGEIFRFISKPWDRKQFLELLQVALAQKDVLVGIEDVIKNVCRVAKMVSKVSVDTETDPQCLTVKIGEDGEDFPKDAVSRFLKMLFEALGLEEEASSFSGAVTKEHGMVSISVDIGRGVMMKVRLPHMHG